MTNIAKDVLKDHQRGHRFLPESFLQSVGLTKESFLMEENSQKIRMAHTKLLQEAHTQLVKGYLFIKAIPQYHVRLRFFCIPPLWMAFETLKTLHTHPHLFQANEDIKISRNQVKKILLTTNLMVPSNWLMEKSFSRCYKNMF